MDNRLSLKKNIISYLKRDISGVLFYIIKYFIDLVNRLFNSIVCYLECFFKNISIGNNCKFYGRTNFYRYPLSKIIIGKNCTFRSDFSSNLIGVTKRCIISTHRENAEIKIGNNCGFSGVSISSSKKIVFGEKVIVGANCYITDFDWHSDKYPTKPMNVIIEDNVWIGLNTIVLKGVKIGKNSIIGAGSVVVRDIPENSIAAGNPCKVLKKFEK